MPRLVIEIAALTLVGICFWLTVGLIAKTPEPWDAEHYWSLAYPASVLLSGVLGIRLAHRGWTAGVAVTLAQFPVMLSLAGAGPMSVVGLLLLCLLAIPAALMSAFGGWIGLRISERS